MRGYFEIGVFNGKCRQNIGTLWRSAYTYGAAGIFTVGRRYKRQSSDTLKTWRKIPLRHYLSWQDLLDKMPFAAQLVCVELTDGAVPLPEFEHPQIAVYLLGSEDNGIPPSILEGHPVVTVPSPRPFCLNVAVAGSLVMYDRWRKNT